MSKSAAKEELIVSGESLEWSPRDGVRMHHQISERRVRKDKTRLSE
jgi:hypothetical protein